MEDKWLTWAKQLQAIASTGLHFSPGDYDRERYEQIAQIANSMLSVMGDVPIQKIESLASDFAKGYATPRVDVRGAVIEEGKVLLVKEETDALWSLPGGYADVGLSPSENIVKEIQEEAGIPVRVKSLYSVKHKARHGYDPDARDFYKIFFLCECVDNSRPAPGVETSEVGFFDIGDLPPLSTGRTIKEDILAAFDVYSHPSTRVEFD